MKAPSGSLLRALGPSLLVAVLAVVLTASTYAQSTAAFLRAYPAVLFGFTLALAAVFRSSRAAMAVTGLALASHALLRLVDVAAVSEELVGYGLNAIGVLLPATLGLAVTLRERTVLSGAGLTRVALVAGAAGFAALAWLAWWRWPIAAVQGRLIAALPETVLGLRQPAASVFVAAAAVVTVQLVRKRNPFEGATLVSLGLSLAALAAGGEADRQALLMAGAGAAQLVALLQGAAASAVSDPLTGLPGRRAFDERLAGLRVPFVIALVDIDHFKKVNDTHGHPVGDQVLRMVAARLREVGGGGTAFRYGGEEFAVVFPGKALPAVEPHLEALRRAVAATPFALRSEARPRRKPERPLPGPARPATLTVTVSIGAAAGTDRSNGAASAVRAADKALYGAKNGGRNRLVCTS